MIGHMYNYDVHSAVIRSGGALQAQYPWTSASYGQANHVIENWGGGS